MRSLHPRPRPRIPDLAVTAGEAGSTRGGGGSPAALDASMRHGRGLQIETDWPSLWRRVNQDLKRRGYAHSTRLFYRQILRQFVTHAACPPSAVDGRTVRAYLRTLRAPRYSPYWTAMNLSALRTVFDKICGCGFLYGRHCPRIPRTLPEILTEDQVVRMLDSATSLRDRMIVGLLYGCGLKVGELRNLHWSDLNVAGKTVTVRSRFGARTLPLPRVLLPLLTEGVRRCSPAAFLFAGADGHRCLSARRGMNRATGPP